MHKTVKIVSIGMDGEATLTHEAQLAIETADLLIGAKRMVEPFALLHKPTFVSYDKHAIAAYIADCPYQTIAVPVSGDSGFYSVAQGLLPLLSDCDTEVISGISSPVYFCAKLHMPWADVHFVSLHGTGGSVIRQICSHEKTFFLLGGRLSPADLCRRLCAYGMAQMQVHIGENLSMSHERILSGRAEQFTALVTDKLCVMLVENPQYERYIPSGIADNGFIRGSVPMTKAEVRCVCVAKLSIGAEDICWDIGCGTGSVSVEMAMRCPDGQVFAVDKNAEAMELTDRNRHRFGCDNIELMHQPAETAIVTLPAPDCVFIGGSGGCIGAVMRAALEKNPACRLVATAVSLETLEDCRAALADCGREAEITQLAVTRTRTIGSHTMLSAENPIFIIKGIQP